MGSEVTGTGSGEPEISNFPPKFKFPAKFKFVPLKFEFIETIQIEQWERFPPKYFTDYS
jgi:hypothetical protein